MAQSFDTVGKELIVLSLPKLYYVIEMLGGKFALR